MIGFAKRTSWRQCALVFVAAVVAVLLLAAAPHDAQAATYTQKGNALAPYKTKKYRVVKNTKYPKKSYLLADRIKYPVDSSDAHELLFSYGNLQASARTHVYLPVSLEGSGDLGNPQAACITPDGRYAYVAYPQTKTSSVGRIIRYDLKALEELGATEGDLSAFNRAVRRLRNGNELTEEEQALVDCMKVGPWFTLGHGSTLAYNPKDGRLWFSSATGKVKTNLTRINMSTLKPDKKIVFRLNKAIVMGNNLAFDSQGRCYFFCGSGGSKWAPKGTIKIYRGTIYSKSVKWKLIMRGVRNFPSDGRQGMGYNPKNNCLYLVSNGVVMRLPVSRLTTLKASDVKVTVFEGTREYEGIGFAKDGTGYLLVNGYPELMKLSAGF